MKFQINLICFVYFHNCICIDDKLDYGNQPKPNDGDDKNQLKPDDDMQPTPDDVQPTPDDDVQPTPDDDVQPTPDDDDQPKPDDDDQPKPIDDDQPKPIDDDDQHRHDNNEDDPKPSVNNGQLLLHHVILLQLCILVVALYNLNKVVHSSVMHIDG